MRPLCSGWAVVRGGIGRRLSWRLLACCLLATVGCERRKADPSAAAADLSSPRAVYDRLREWHAGHSYMSMMPWIHPAARDDLIEVLVAVDELMLANTSAQVAIAQSCPSIDPRPFDMSAISNFLDLFSRDAEFVGEKIEGETAVVTIQVARRLPLKHLRFERDQGRWVYHPGPLPDGLAASIRLLAKGLDRFATAIAAGTCSPDKVDSEFRYRVVARLDALRKLAAPATAPAEPASQAAG